MKIGKIVSVEYDKFCVRLFNTTRNSTVNIEGKVYYFGNIGSYLKTLNSAGEYIFCEVIAIKDWLDKEMLKEKNFNSNFNLDSNREIIIKPIGTLHNRTFNMGVGLYPSIYSDVEIVTYQDLDDILTTNNSLEDKKVHKTICIGNSKSLLNYEINLNINKLFNIHTAVLGNSGSGKSNTIAHILHEVYVKSNYSAIGAKTIIFDANGEYPKAFDKGFNKPENLTPIFYKPNISKDGDGFKKFHLPYYLLNLDEWLSFLMASERTQKPFWDNVLQECYKFYKIFGKDESDTGTFVNYIKWKLTNILSLIVTRVESDTSKMTAAKGAISKMYEICNAYLDKEVGEKDENIIDLKNFLTICNNLCYVHYGNNDDTISSSLNEFIANDTIKYVSLKYSGQGVELTDKDQITNEEKYFLQIDEAKALDIKSLKLKNNEYFDYKFLKSAVDLVLLEEEARGNLKIRDFISTLLSRLDFFLYNPECEFMRYDAGLYKNSNDYLDKVFGINDKNYQKQLITIDSSEVGIDILELMTSVTSRMIFDFRKTKIGNNRQQRPIHIILDEAHRYINKNTNYVLKENIFEKIAREGRKYSLYLIISSQRPSELSQTVLSQCGNYIVHRIQNEIDMKYIYSVLPYFSEDYILKIKQAVPGEALIFGNCVPMPLMVKVKEADPAPNSDNCIIDEEWYKEYKN